MPEFDVESGGQRYRVTADNEQAARNAVGQQAMGEAMVGGAGTMFIAYAVMAVVAIIILTLRFGIAVFKMYPLYIVVLLAALAALIVVPRFIPGIRKVKPLRIITGLAAAAAVFFFFGRAADTVYRNTDMIIPSWYSADYIQALPDGSAPKLYEKRQNKGEVLATLTPGEKVQVIGGGFMGLGGRKIIVRMGEDNPLTDSFRITTAAGVSGWVEAAAFPEDANREAEKSGGVRLGDVDDLSSHVSGDLTATYSGRVDRESERLLNKYIGEFWGRTRESVKLNQEKLRNSSLPVGIDAPFSFTSGDNLQPTQMGQPETIRLEYAAYLEDCTVLALSLSHRIGFGTQSFLFGAEAAEYKNSLTVTDLDSKETWRIIPADFYEYVFDNEDGSWTGYAFFPPFKSRNFSLTHTLPPIPEKPNKKISYTSWDFPEVRIR